MATSPEQPPSKIRLHWLGRMHLQHKAWLITSVVITSLSVCMGFGVYHTYRRSFEQLEREEVQASVQRLSNILTMQLETLGRTTKDYANWDDSAAYIEKPNADYDAANLNEATFTTLDLNAFLLFDRQGKLVGGRALDADGALREPDAALWKRTLAPLLPLAQGEDAQGGGAFLRIPQGVGMADLRPIRQNGGFGPNRGTLVLLRKVDTRMVEQLRRLSGLEIQLQGIEYNMGDPIERALLEQDSASVPMIAVDNSLLAFHHTLKDPSGKVIAHFHGRMPRRLMDQGRQAQMVLYAGIFSTTVMAGLAMIWLLRSLVIARLEKMHAEVRRIAEHADANGRVSEEGDDELAELGKQINLMLEALAYAEVRNAQITETSERLEAQLVQAQKMEAIGTMAGGLAHDFNNTLSCILGSADLLRYEVPQNHPAQEHVRRIEKAGTSAAALIQQLLTVSRKQTLKPEPISLSATVMDALKLLEAALPRNIEFEITTLATQDTVLADAAQIHQVVMNLGTNAAHAMASKKLGKFRVCVEDCHAPHADYPETAALAPGKYLRMSLSDNGTGISKENLERIFEPFFTTKPSGSGSGLGLAVVHGIIGKHNGCLSVRSIPNEGTTFIIHLPLVAGAPSLASDPQAKHRPLRETELQVLLVDDDKLVCDTIANGLKKQGHRVLPVTSAQEALRLAADPACELSILVTDQLMPGMTGMQLGAKVRELRPSLPMLLISGYAASLEEAEIQEAGFTGMLQKPLTAGQISQAIIAATRTGMTAG